MPEMNLNIDLYRTMYLIRETEETIQRHYLEDGMKTPMHMSMGEEAIAAGVCLALGPADQVLCSYRSHGVYLARTRETDAFFAEMYGRASGVAQGKGGSMHLMAPAAGLLCTSAIVATQIPVAVGAAFANKTAGNGKVVAVFFGDGAVDEGVFWESVNAACLWQLPVLFVCEDNGYAVHAPVEARHGYESIAEVVERFNCVVSGTDSTDAEHIHRLTKETVSTMKERGCPAFLHLKYYRYLEHVGVFEDFDAGYRSRAEFERWSERDPVRLQREKLLGMIPENEIHKIEAAIDAQVAESLAHARKAPFPQDDVLYEGLPV